MADSRFVTPRYRRTLKVHILGHSFVRRLDEYLYKLNTPGPKPSINLYLSMDDFSVSYHGVGGATVSANNGKRLQSKLRRNEVCGSDIVFLDIGSNDLCFKEQDPVKLAQDIIKVANFLILGFAVKRVVVGAILPRKRIPAGVADYNERVVCTNNALKDLCQAELGISFWYHAKFQNPEHDLFQADGVHLNNGYGYKKYVKSVRGAILQASKLLK